MYFMSHSKVILRSDERMKRNREAIERCRKNLYSDLTGELFNQESTVYDESDTNSIEQISDWLKQQGTLLPSTFDLIQKSSEQLLMFALKNVFKEEPIISYELAFYHGIGNKFGKFCYHCISNDPVKGIQHNIGRICSFNRVGRWLLKDPGNYCSTCHTNLFHFIQFNKNDW